MAVTLEQLAERVAHLERLLKRHDVWIDHQQKETDARLADVDQHLQQQDTTMHDLSQQVKAGFDEVSKGLAGLTKRLDWQDGQFADLNANITEVRNITADLVRHEGEGEQKA